MHEHRGDQACIVDLNTRNRVLKHQTPPLGMHSRPVWEELEESFQAPNPSLGFGDGKTKPPASYRRPGTNAPELYEVLRGVIQGLLLRMEAEERLANQEMLRRGTMTYPEEDVRIDEVRHQSWSE